MSSSTAFRVIKLGSIKSVSALKHRSVPIAILHRLKLVDQVCPISNSFYKVRLAPGVSNTDFQAKLEALNKANGDNLFHSYFNGSDTIDLNPALVKAKTSHSFFVVDCPPFSISDSLVREFFSSLQATDVSVVWGTGPFFFFFTRSTKFISKELINKYKRASSKPQSPALEELTKGAI